MDVVDARSVEPGVSPHNDVNVLLLDVDGILDEVEEVVLGCVLVLKGLEVVLHGFSYNISSHKVVKLLQDLGSLSVTDVIIALHFKIIAKSTYKHHLCV